MRIFGIDIAGIIHKEISPGLPSVTLTVVTDGSRTDGNLAGGRNPTEVAYACAGLAIENIGQLVDGRSVGSDEAIVMITAGSISGGTVAPKPRDKITYEHAGATRTRPIVRVGTDPAQAAWLCVVRG